MRVLCVNCGSATLKFDLFDVPPTQGAHSRVATGLIDRIGQDSRLAFSLPGGRTVAADASIADHGMAMKAALSQLNEQGLLHGIDAAGHRIVHGGPRFRAATLIDEGVLENIEAVSELAPLHNRPALRAITAAREAIGADTPMVATFDTAFYADLPDIAAIYAIPWSLSEKHSIRRYGFHGLAHRYMVQRYRELRAGITRPRLITLQLGNGCSATASADCRPIDTSMGLTPLEGLIMGTRSGDIDPALPLFLADKEGLTNDEVDALLNSRSGLLGVSGSSSDMRDLLAASTAGDVRATLAVDAFSYRVRKYVGAYLAALGGADAIIFAGGIGENSHEIRQRICAGFEWAGLELNRVRNEEASAQEARISDESSKIECWVMQADEARVISEDVAALLKSR